MLRSTKGQSYRRASTTVRGTSSAIGAVVGVLAPLWVVAAAGAADLSYTEAQASADEAAYRE